MKRSVEFHRRALDDFDALDQATRERVVAAIDRFAKSGQGDVKSLKGKLQGRYRLRVGKWRVIFRLTPEVMTVSSIDNRGQAY